MGNFAFGCRFQVALKYPPRQLHLPNTLTNNCCTRIQYFVSKGHSSRMNMGAEKNSTNLERKPRGNNEVNDVTMRSVPIDVGGR